VFSNRSDISVVRTPTVIRQFLVVIRAGAVPRPSFFTDPLPSDRRYDVAMNYYAPPHADDAMQHGAEFVFGGGLSKFHAAKLFIERLKLLDVYDGIFFLDDDLELLFDPDEFLSLCVEFQLDIAQPSLTHDSSGFDITKCHPGLKLRRTNYVEVMAPFMSRRFLTRFVQTFDWCVSGWGLDIYWGHQLGPDLSAAIVDQFVIRHAKPVDLKGGAFYKYLESIGVDPERDKQRIFQMLGIREYVVQPVGFLCNTTQITCQYVK
jgi:hypothetical protein